MRTPVVLAGLLVVAVAGPAAADATPSPSSSVTVSVDPAVLVAGGAATVTATAPPGSALQLLAYSRPSTAYRVVRQGTVPDSGRLTWQVVPSTNTRLYAQAGDVASPSVVLPVRNRIALTVTRSADDGSTVFAGTVVPRRAGRAVSVYRSAGSGAALVTRATTDDRGNFSVHRCFTGSGRFAFAAATGTDAVSSAGISPARTASVSPCPDGPAVRVGDGDNGRTVDLRVGQRLAVTLRNPGDGGYSLRAQPVDPRVLATLPITHQAPAPSPTPVAGDFGTDTFPYRARAHGTTVVTIGYHRFDNPTPESTWMLRVRVA